MSEAENSTRSTASMTGQPMRVQPAPIRTAQGGPEEAAGAGPAAARPRESVRTRGPVIPPRQAPRDRAMAPGRGPHQRIGMPYCSPPLVHSALRPRLIFRGDPSPTLRSNTSP